MKKILAVVFSLSLFLSLGSPAFASETNDIQKVLDMIEKTNEEIDKEIEKAVKEADELQADYLLDIRKLEEGDKVVKLKEEKAEVKSELNLTQGDLNKQNKLNDKLIEIEEKIAKENAKLDEKIAEINADIEEATLLLISADDKDTEKIEKKISKLNDKLNKRSEKAQEKTAKYTKELEKVITDIYNKTLEMSAEAIEKAAEKGVIAECSWKLVRFADQWVWIDPVRVVKL